jgi:hypothetical protein
VETSINGRVAWLFAFDFPGAPFFAPSAKGGKPLTLPSHFPFSHFTRSSVGQSTRALKNCTDGQ